MKATAVLATLVAAVLMSSCGGKEQAAPPVPNTPAGSNAAPAAATPPVFAKLKGRWLRPDGGYVVEVRDVTPEGKLDAAYFNPRAIHVSRAEATAQGSGCKVFIELQDVNYPGCVYTLVYEPATDRMTGIYYQAALDQSFDVEFVRQP